MECFLKGFIGIGVYFKEMSWYMIIIAILQGKYVKCIIFEHW